MGGTKCEMRDVRREVKQKKLRIRRIRRGPVKKGLTETRHSTKKILLESACTRVYQGCNKSRERNVMSFGKSYIYLVSVLSDPFHSHSSVALVTTSRLRRSSPRRQTKSLRAP